MKAIDMHANEDVTRVLVGNKADMTDKKVIDAAHGAQLAADYNIKFFETSAKTAENVADLFESYA